MKLFFILSLSFLSFSAFGLGLKWSGNYNLVSDTCYYSNGSTYDCSPMTHLIPTKIWISVNVDPKVGDEVMIKYQEIKDQNIYNDFNGGLIGPAKQDMTAPRGYFADIGSFACKVSNAECFYNVSTSNSSATIRGPNNRNSIYLYQIEAQGDQLTIESKLDLLGFHPNQLVRKMVFLRSN